MKAIFFMTGLLLLCAGAALAQSTSPKAARSTKYTLFPDFDADVARLNKQAAADAKDKRATVRSTRAQIFQDYKPQQSTARPATQLNARKAPQGGKNPSDATAAEQNKLREELSKPIQVTPVPTQEKQAPKQ